MSGLLSLGPCPTCGKYFQSRDRKMFCSLVCYHRSDLFKRLVKERAAAQTVREARTCLCCGVEFQAKPSDKRRYCSKLCRRKWFAERHDRWIANPQKIALPQAYDEFLSQDELACIVEGCDWVGRSLGAHVNFVHGIPAAELKALAGFNRTTGLVGASLSRALSERPYTHLRDNPEDAAARLVKMRAGIANGPRPTARLEGRELARKVLAERRAAAKTTAYTCTRCGTLFIRTGIKGAAKYCEPCRPLAHAEYHNAKNTPLACSTCGVEFLGNQGQRLRARKGLVVFCVPCLRTERTAKLALGRASRKRRRHVPQRGPCPTCGKMFQHYAPQTYCCAACRYASPGFKELMLKNLTSKRRSDT